LIVGVAAAFRYLMPPSRPSALVRPTHGQRQGSEVWFVISVVIGWMLGLGFVADLTTGLFRE
jgi:LPS O-antigen subunit length determinant protein (WzzB/FepE family)